MNRTQSRRIWLAVFTILTSFLLFSAPSVQAQITRGAAYSDQTFSYTAAGSRLELNRTSTDFSVTAQGQVKLGLTGDFNFFPGRAAGTAYIDIYGYLPLLVGDLPVQISNFELTVNAKWVNGGGSSTAPNVTQGSVYGTLYEQLGATPAQGDPSVASAISGLVADFKGNGFKSVSPTSFAGIPSSYVLAAKTNYYLQLQAHTFSDNTTWTATMPSVTLTNEFGGTFNDGYAGYRVGFSWVTVPEPNTVTLALIVAFGLGARNLGRRWIGPWARARISRWGDCHAEA